MPARKKTTRKRPARKAARRPKTTRRAAKRTRNPHGFPEHLIDMERDGFVREFKAWFGNGWEPTPTADIARWSPIAKDAGVSMVDLRSANQRITSDTPFLTADRRVAKRERLAWKLIEQVENASNDQIAEYLEHTMALNARRRAAKAARSAR